MISKYKYKFPVYGRYREASPVSLFITSQNKKQFSIELLAFKYTFKGILKSYRKTKTRKSEKHLGIIEH